MSDSFTPDSGQQVTPDGHVSYDFDGHIHARGLDLDAGDTATPPNDRRVRWLRTSDGAVVADIFASEVPGNRSLDVLMEAAGGETGVARFGTNRPAGFSGLQTGSAGIVTAIAQGTVARTILDTLGQSEFLQLVSLGKIALDFGNTTAFFNASPFSNAATVNHGLTRTPRFYALIGAGNGFRMAFEITAESSSSFTFVAEAVDGGVKGPGNAGVRWAAIG